jgi:hypothetical protein
VADATDRTVDRVRERFPRARGWFKLVADARFVSAPDGRLTPDFGALTHPRVRARDGAGFSLEPRFPALAVDAVRIASSADPARLFVEITPRAAARVAARVEDGLVVYPDAYLDTDVMFKATPTHVDEYLLLKSRAAPTTWRYGVRRGPGLAALRQAGNSVEAVDAAGRPWLRAGRPVATDRRGTRVEGTITVDGDDLVVAIDVSALELPVLVDPDWRSTGDMAYGRFYHRVNVLPDGRLVATGGCSASVCSGDLTLPACPTVVGAAEVLNLDTRTWGQVGLGVPRFFHAAEALGDGRLLVAGGCTNSDCSTTTDSLQLWTFADGFDDGPPLALARGGLASARLGDGRVLVAGGCWSSGCTAISELFDPATDTLAQTGPLVTPRGRAAAVTLADGRVLVAGGCTSIECAGVLASAELYDPQDGTWTVVGAMDTPRAGHFAALLADGRVLIGGGCSDAACTTVLASTEIFSPADMTFAPGPELGQPRLGADAVTLPDGRVLVSQGCASRTSCDLDNEVYLPAAEDFGPFPPSVTVRAFHQVVRHDASRQVVAVGGCQPQTCSWWNETFDISDAYDGDAGPLPPDGGGGGGGGGDSGGGCGCRAGGAPEPAPRGGAGALVIACLAAVAAAARRRRR